jgi:hypothetical protein
MMTKDENLGIVGIYKISCNTSNRNVILHAYNKEIHKALYNKKMTKKETVNLFLLIITMTCNY